MPFRAICRLLVCFASVLLFASVLGPSADGAAPPSVEDLRSRLEERAENLAELPVALRGEVRNGSGPLHGATIEVAGLKATSAADGSFVLRGLARRNGLATVRAAGHVGRVVVFAGDQPADVSLVELGAVVLDERATSTTSIVFGGDVSLGRRYLDPSGSAARNEMPLNDPDATIRVEHARHDTRELLRDLEQVLAPHDLRSLNLETVVTDDPRDPQASQRYVFFTLPDSAAAVADIGVDYVSLGNNHVWDYGTAGVQDTIEHLDALSVAHSGSGMNEAEAFEPAVVTSPSGTDFVMHSWVATRPDDEFYAQHATADRAGGANAADETLVTAALAASARSDAVSVAHVHTGIEYTEQPVVWDPDAMVQTRLGYAVEGGADVVVAHHPHVAQGYAFADDVLVAHSLGNLVFDQDRLDTRYGALLSTVFDGAALRSARVDPIHIADYRPTLAVGEPADLALRTWSMSSADDVVLVPDVSGARIMRREDASRASRSLTATLTPDETGTAYLDLRHLRLPGESLGRVDGVEPAMVSLGRDLMLLGGMEDLDLDAVDHEATGWSYGSSTMMCPSEARRGSGALCSFRSPAHEGPSSIRFGSRIRVSGDRTNQPNRDLTLLVYEAGVDRGDLAVNVTWTVSQGSRDFGTTEVARLPERTGGWLPHWVTIPDPGVDETLDPDVPFSTTPLSEYPRALRVSIGHEPPTFAEGYVVLDDAAVISWMQPSQRSGRYATPSPFDFVRVDGLTAPIEVAIEFDRWLPKSSDSQ